MVRKGIGKKIRFEVFKRDSFKCQYCGRSSPEIVLVIDHINPVSSGGKDDITNLITSCFDCNSGKGKRSLSDETVVSKRKKQLDDLQERREQIEMIYEWQIGLINIEEEMSRNAIEYLEMFTPCISYSEQAYKYMNRIIRRYGLSEILECIRISSEQYIKIFDGCATLESSKKCYEYIEKIASTRKKMKDKPYLQDLYRIRGILRSRVYCNEWLALSLLEKSYLNGHDVEELYEIAENARNWTEWRTTMEGLLEDK